MTDNEPNPIVKAVIAVGVVAIIAALATGLLWLFARPTDSEVQSTRADMCLLVHPDNRPAFDDCVAGK